MARALQDILTELNSVYDPQRQSYNNQISSLDPQLEAEQKGLQAQKEDSFRQITDQANRRGMFYSGLPIAEEQRYTGQQFLPAVANLRAKYSSQRFGLQDAIAKITADQYNTAYGVRQKELEVDEQRRQFDEQMAAQERARRAAAAGSGGGGGYSFGGGGGGGGVAAPAAKAGINWQGIVQQNNPYVFKDMLSNANQTYFGGRASYGQLAGWLQGQIGKIPSGSAADLALRNIYLKTEIDPTRQALSAVNRGIGR